MKNKVFSLLAVSVFMLSSLNVSAIATANVNQNETKSIVLEDDGLLCDAIAKKARKLLEKKAEFSEETLDKIEDAIAAACDELL